MPLFCFCSILKKEWYSSIFPQWLCPSQFQDHVCYAGYMVNSTTRSKWELHKCLQKDTTSVWASQIFYCEVRKLIAKPKKTLECVGKAPCATYMEHIQCFWGALQRQVSVQNRWTGHTYVQWNCHICTALDRRHKYSRTHYPTAEVLENVGWDWQDKVKQLSRWEIHLVNLIHFYITFNTIFWRRHLRLENRNKLPSSSSIFNLARKLPTFRLSFRALKTEFLLVLHVVFQQS